MIRERATIDFRPFDPATDYPAVVAFICDVNAYDDEDWFPTEASLPIDWQLHRGFEPSRDVVLVELDGRLVGLGRTDWRERTGKIIHNSEVWVDPVERRRGIGRQILSRLEQQARASVADGTGGPGELPHFLNAGADDSNHASLAFAQDAGYAPVRYGFLMRRPLDVDIPDVPMPAGLEVRPVLPEHHRAIWESDTEAFRDHWEARVREDSEFAQFTEHPDTDTSLWQVAWDGDEVAGSVLNGIYPDENAKVGVQLGWLDHVSVRRPWRRRGLASALIARSLRVLRDRGMEIASLGVDAENPTGALGVYEKLGFTPHRRWVTYRKPM